MIPSDEPVATTAEKKKNPQGLTPDPIECSEANCKGVPVTAYYIKGSGQFQFACDIHFCCHTSTGPCVMEDRIEDYLKKRKRKMYQWQLGEYL